MKRIHAFAAPLRAAFSALLLGTCALQVSPALGQATPNPPERMTYQGFLVGSDGVALGNAAPKNYDVIFKIYNHETAGDPVNLLWAEQQTVTVDKGYFNVLLGEGAPTGDPRPALSTLFKGATASDRFVAITVKGIGSGGANVDILPRLRLMTSPYSFLAQSAVKLVQDNGAGTDLLTSSGNLLTLNGSIDMTVGNSLEFGANAPGKQGDAGRLGYQLYDDGLDIVGAGTTGNNRKVSIFAEGGLNVSGTITATGFNGSGANLTGVAKTGANTFSGTQTITGGNLQIDNQAIFLAKNSSGTVENFLWPRWSDNVTYMNYGSGGLNIRNNASTSALFVGNDLRATFQAGVLAKGGFPGGGNGNNVGYAFSGNGGDNDSGMFSDADGFVRFTSNGELKLSVYPSGAYIHNGGLTVDSFNGTTFKVDGDTIKVFNGSNKAKYFQMFRYDQGVAIQGFGGGWGNASGDFRQITWDGDGNWDAASDRKLKKDIVDAEPLLDRALQVQVRRYHWKDDPAEAKMALGVIAQELQPLFPDLIATQVNPTTKETNLAVGYSDFGLIAIKAIQELKAQHDAEVKDLRAQLAELKAQMTAVLQANPGAPAVPGKGTQTASVSRR